MRERVRTVAAEYGIGDRVCLRECPDPGSVGDCVYEFGRFIYRVDWDYHPRDLGWYREDELMPATTSAGARRLMGSREQPDEPA